jgi:hypothetical protein
MENLEERRLYSAVHFAAAKLSSAKKTKSPKPAPIVSPLGTWQGKGIGHFLQEAPGPGDITKKKIKVKDTLTISNTGAISDPIQGRISSDWVTDQFDTYELQGFQAAAAGGKWNISLDGNNYIAGGIFNPSLIGGSRVQLSGTMDSKAKTMSGTYTVYINQEPYFAVKFSIKK